MLGMVNDIDATDGRGIGFGSWDWVGLGVGGMGWDG